MTTGTSTDTGPAPSERTAPQQIDGAPGGFPGRDTAGVRLAAPSAGSVVGSPGRRIRERESPEDDEAVLAPVPAPVARRSFRERPEDDEAVPAYTSEPACRRVR